MTHRSESQALRTRHHQETQRRHTAPKFPVALQAAIGARFIAREDLSAYRKDVTTGLYGGDVSLRKSPRQTSEGQKRMKRFGKVDIPADAFTVMLKRD